MNVDEGCGNHVAEPYKLNALVVGGVAFVCLESGMAGILCHYVCGFHLVFGGGSLSFVMECSCVSRRTPAAIVTDGWNPSDIS